MPAQVPGIGHPILVFLRGGDLITGGTLTRFFGFHVAVLPALTTLFLAIHLGLVQRQGMSVPPSVEQEWKAHPSRRREIKFFPDFVLREAMAWYIALGVLGVLAALLPWPLGTKADPFASAPAGIKPEWYFLFMYQTLRFIPAQFLFIPGEMVGIVAFGFIAVLWVFLPFFDPDGRGRSRKVVLGIGVFSLVYLGVMSVLGYLTH
jgi:quinol-cytochrome oxidoreductase complex cytochrome b subunit